MASTSITLSALSISPSTSQPHRNPSASSPSLPCHLPPYNLSTTFMGKKLSIRISNLNNLASKHRTAVATVLFSLPTAKPDRNSTGKSPKWSARAIKSFAMAELEARKLKYPNTGTEALLMGILVEGTSLAAKFLRANGITLFKVRDETVNLLGKSDLYVFSPEHPPLTEPAQRALDWAVDQKLKSGENGEITVTHLLLGIWSEKESAGHKILASLGFDDEKAKELSKSIMLALNKEAKNLHTVKPLPIQPPKDIAWWSFSSESYSAYGVFQDSLTMLLRYKFDILEFKNSIQH